VEGKRENSDIPRSEDTLHEDEGGGRSRPSGCRCPEVGVERRRTGSAGQRGDANHLWVQMKRRYFLMLKTQPGTRTVELSHQHLHMHYVERRATGGPPDTGGQLGEDLDPAEGGEPPTAFDERTTEQLFANLGRELDGADILRVTGHRWLSGGDGELLGEFYRLVSPFRARGGRVEFG
jgi:hypothetical protein